MCWSRVLDEGVVIAGDIKIKLVDIELLTIQVRLLIASVDRAREMGLDWWMTNPESHAKMERDAERDWRRSGSVSRSSKVYFPGRPRRHAGVA